MLQATTFASQRSIGMQDSRPGSATLPDGVDHIASRIGIWDRHASPIAFLLLGGLICLALLGFAGGQRSPWTSVDFGPVTLSVKTPTLIRNGEFFETDIRIAADERLEDATLAIDADLWRDMTINTMIPAPAEESFEAGEMRFSYGVLEAGRSLRVKIDGQINPPLFAGNKGSIAVYDGERLIGRQAIAIRVLP